MMSNYNLELFKLKADLCKVFSDPKRLLIISELRNREKQVGDLANTLEMSQAEVSRQLALLRSKGVVQSRRDGTCIYYELTDIRIVEACDLVHEVLLSNLEKNRELAERHLA
ncbi:ArsR/SmtB family transcription factor [Chloroflexota bacterium]